MSRISYKTLIGCSPLAILGLTHMKANDAGQTYTPTEIGKMLAPPMSAVKTNMLMAANGLQVKDEAGHWVPTGAADGLYEWLDTNKRHSDGTMVKQLKWFRAVLERLGADYLTGEAA